MSAATAVDSVALVGSLRENVAPGDARGLMSAPAIPMVTTVLPEMINQLANACELATSPALNQGEDILTH